MGISEINLYRLSGALLMSSACLYLHLCNIKCNAESMYVPCSYDCIAQGFHSLAKAGSTAKDSCLKYRW